MSSMIPPFLIVYLLSAGITAAVALWALQRHRERGAVPFSMMVGAMALWSVGICGMLLAPTPEMKLRWLTVQDIAMFSVAVNWLLFALNYTHRWHTSALDWRALALWVPVGIGLALNATNPQHRLMYTDWRIEPMLGAVQLSFGPAYWMSTAYALSTGVIGMAVIARGLGPAPSFFRQYSRLLLGCGLSVLVVDVIRFAGLVPVDLTPVVIAVFATQMATRYSRNLIFGVVPIARPLVVRSMNEGIIILSNTGMVISVNPAAEAMLRLKAKQVIGQPADDLLHEFPVLVNGRARETYQIVHAQNIDGAMRILEARERVLLRRDGAIGGRLILLRDVTARESEREHALILTLEQRRHDLLTTFITGAAHEFRTPLSVIRASAYLASRNPDLTFCKAQHGKIDSQVARLNRMIDQMQMMVQLDAGLELAPDTQSLNALVREAIHRCSALLSGRSLVLMLDDELPPLQGDSHLLVLALEELLRNAALYSPQSSPIVVSTELQHGWLCVRVADQGAGIAPEVRERMFERLYRGDPARTTPGFGLGLAIVRSVLEAHGGQIEIESLPAGGTTAHVMLRPDPSQVQPPSSAGGTPARAAVSVS